MPVVTTSAVRSALRDVEPAVASTMQPAKGAVVSAMWSAVRPMTTALGSAAGSAVWPVEGFMVASAVGSATAGDRSVAGDVAGAIGPPVRSA